MNFCLLQQHGKEILKLQIRELQNLLDGGLLSDRRIVVGLQNPQLVGVHILSNIYSRKEIHFYRLAGLNR